MSIIFMEMKRIRALMLFKMKHKSVNKWRKNMGLTEVFYLGKDVGGGGA